MSNQFTEIKGSTLTDPPKKNTESFQACVQKDPPLQDPLKLDKLQNIVDSLILGIGRSDKEKISIKEQVKDIDKTLNNVYFQIDQLNKRFDSQQETPQTRVSSGIGAKELVENSTKVLENQIKECTTRIDMLERNWWNSRIELDCVQEDLDKFHKFLTTPWYKRIFL